MQSENLEERYAIKFCFKFGKNATETCGMLQTAFGTSCMNRASVFEWHKRFKDGGESVRDNERCGRSKEVNTPVLIGQRVGLTKGDQEKIPREEASTLSNWVSGISVMDNASVHNSILVTDYSTKMGIKTVPQPSYSPDLAPCDFFLFPKLRGCRYETIGEMKEVLTEVIDTLTQEDFQAGHPEVVGTVQQVHCSRRRLLRRGLEFHMYQ